MSVEYKAYAGLDDSSKLFEYLDSIGEPRPNPTMYIAFVAEDDGQIKAAVVIQSIPFGEPTHAEKGYGMHLSPLFDMAKDFVLKSGAPRMICHTANRTMKLMLEEAGAEEYPQQEVFYDWRKPEVVTGNTQEMANASK